MRSPKKALRTFRWVGRFGSKPSRLGPGIFRPTPPRRTRSALRALSSSTRRSLGAPALARLADESFNTPNWWFSRGLCLKQPHTGHHRNTSNTSKFFTCSFHKSSAQLATRPNVESGWFICTFAQQPESGLRLCPNLKSHFLHRMMRGSTRAQGKQSGDNHRPPKSYDTMARKRPAPRLPLTK